MCRIHNPLCEEGAPRGLCVHGGWTVVTADGKWSAQFEHTIRVTTDGAEILTLA